MTIPGFTGKVLRVDLTASKVSVEEIKWDWAEKFIGGRGLAARYAWDEIKAGVEPLSPENVLMVWTGPVEGTMVPLNGRYLFATKSPATGTYLDCYVGGHLGPELKYAGFDGIIIKGRASKPVYLYIKDGKAELKDGSKLWGKNTIDVQKMIRDENNDQKIRIASVGPAGENMSKMACICSDIYRQAARGGVGAVMGSKNLKAIAVRGTMGLAVSNISKIVEVCKESYKVDGLNNPDNEGMITDGTPMIVTMSQDSGILPTRNFQDGMFDDVSKIDTETLKANHTIRRRACFGCVLACASWTKGRGRFESAKVEGPEYETIALCGSNCGVGDLSAIIKFNMECDMYGIDTMSAGDTIAFAMELYEKGIITKNETDGIDLKFGNIDAYVAMPQILALRKGNLGKLFADGTAPAVKAIGKDSYKYAMHVKGMELPAY
ncbi:MAG: aldehyde ferredoxin oxidoreductase, partial [Thermoplasmata archaeon]|nr:aldehyde ferredoxin oxidoreductase [Thermoplasmata archaeon]